MQNTPLTSKDWFARALEVPAGEARRRYLRQACADSAMRAEVESLVAAHEAAETREVRARDRGSPDRTSATAAADLAAAFLRGAHPVDEKELMTFLEGWNAEVRKEARERIEAGVRVRDFGASAPSSGPAAFPTPSIPGYTLEHRVGAGSLGVVYRARDEKLNRPVALKILRPGPNQAIRDRLVREARKAAALNDPGVVTIYAVLDETNPPAIVMELVEGFPLDRYAAKLDFRQRAHLLREVARGLSAAHERGLVHRDLKPENVIVGPDMRPRILDFGLALTLAEAREEGRGFEGTPLYASPEQVRGEPLTPASDVFSFGSLMFRVLTGQAPFRGENLGEVLHAVATTTPPSPGDLAVGLPQDLQAICLACLAWDPADRPSARELGLELGRFLLGEPVRLRPKLYHDALRRSISEYSSQAHAWATQSMISGEERDALEILHRRLLADEDHWIIDARRITLLQTVLACGTWLGVVATLLTVWLLRQDLAPPWRWLLPSMFTAALLGAGYAAHRLREGLASATFLAGAALAVAPCMLALLGEAGLWATPPPGVKQLLPGDFTNAQVLAASVTALILSALSWWRLRMTGFAWTTAALATGAYLSVLLVFNWLDQKAEIQALWCLPLALMEPVALLLERQGRVRWTLPFHAVALAAMVGSLDVMAFQGPTLSMLGVDKLGGPYFDPDRLRALSVTANGLLFFALMLLTERAGSLDLRRGSKLLEILAILHTLGSLFSNALSHRGQPYVRVDVWLYLAVAILFVVVAPFRSRWRILVGGLGGCGLGCYLLVHLELVARKPFIIALGVSGLLLALGAFAYTRWGPSCRWPGRAASRPAPEA